MEKLMGFVLSIVLLLLVTATSGETSTPPWIVTGEEAALPATAKRDAIQPESMRQEGVVSAGEETPAGPIIVVEKPEGDGLYNGLIDIVIHFKKNPMGDKVDMDSLRVIWVQFGIDITDRIRPYVKEMSIDATKVEFPEGEYEFEIRIQDAEQMESSKLVLVRVQ